MKSGASNLTAFHQSLLLALHCELAHKLQQVKLQQILHV